MVWNFWHQFLTQFSLLFQVVPFFFLSMAALRTTTIKLSDWLLDLFQPIRLWLSKLPWRAIWMVPSERALKTKSETGVKSFTQFCVGSFLWKTNSEYTTVIRNSGLKYKWPNSLGWWSVWGWPQSKEQRLIFGSFWKHCYPKLWSLLACARKAMTPPPPMH